MVKRQIDDDVVVWESIRADALGRMQGIGLGADFWLTATSSVVHRQS